MDKKDKKEDRKNAQVPLVNNRVQDLQDDTQRDVSDPRGNNTPTVHKTFKEFSSKIKGNPPQPPVVAEPKIPAKAKNHLANNLVKK